MTTSRVEFDFDIAWDAFEKDGDALPVEAELRRQAGKYGCSLKHIEYDGPGGGNPCVTAEAPNRDSAEKFLTEVYNDAQVAKDTCDTNGI